MADMDALRALAEKGDAESQYEMGLHFETRKMIPEACRWFEEAAEQNHVESQFKLGFFYKWGEENFPKDVEKGRFWLTLAAEADHPKAQFHLGCMCEREQSFDEAAKWFEKAAQQGEDRAMYRFALLHEDRLIEGSNIQVAVKYYAKLSVEPYNNKEAMVNLGLLYCHGDQIERDARKGRKLIERCKPFHDLAPYDCRRVGVIYCTGEINPDNEPDIDDLTIGMELLNIAIKDGLSGYHPKNITFAKELVELSQRRKETLLKKKELGQISDVIYEAERNNVTSKATSCVSTFEEIYFRKAAFSEETIRNDLQGCKMMDSISAYGSGGQTYELHKRKERYSRIFSQNISELRNGLDPIMQIKSKYPDDKLVQETIAKFNNVIQHIMYLNSIVKDF